MAGSFLGNALGGVIVIGAIILFLWFMAKREERALTKERANYSHEEIATDFTLWGKFVNYYAEKGEEMTNEAFNGLSLDDRLQMLNSRFG